MKTSGRNARPALRGEGGGVGRRHLSIDQAPLPHPWLIREECGIICVFVGTVTNRCGLVLAMILPS